jgi:hypothetical protein
MSSNPTNEPTASIDEASAECSIGFIILRHVNDQLTNQYWIHCYNSIRKYYPENYILIIDDNSNYQHITNHILYKTTIIQSEFSGRGELLPYYYYLQNKLFDIAVILHDSVFVNTYIDFTTDKYNIIWEFEHTWDQIADETQLINVFNDVELVNFYENKSLWQGSFGGMVVIRHDFLQEMNNKYEISKLLDHVLTRHNRCSFERVIACLLQTTHSTTTLYGNIHTYMNWGTAFHQKEHCNHLPLIKVWTGR